MQCRIMCAVKSGLSVTTAFFSTLELRNEPGSTEVIIWHSIERKDIIEGSKTTTITGIIQNRYKCTKYNLNDKVARI